MSVSIKPARRVTREMKFRLSDLQVGEFVLSVDQYDESNDTFQVSLHDCSPSEGLRGHTLPAVLLPFLTGECGEPDEFVQTRWIVTHPGF